MTTDVTGQTIPGRLAGRQRAMILPFAMLAAVLFSARAPIALAQAVRGQVVETATGTPIGNGFVVLVDSAGRELGRTLSDTQGRYFLRAPRAGTYQLRSERIGFRVATSEPFLLLPGDTRDFPLSITAVPVRLAAIEIGTESACTSQPGEGLSTATLWEEARKALTAVAWSEQQGRLHVRMQVYHRELTTGLRVHQESRNEVSGPATRPFGSPPAAVLARTGFVHTSADSGLTFYGPDAQVLFSDEFLRTHCFRTRAGSSETAGLVGLAFEPVRGRDLPDIEGTIWLDTATAGLRSVDFRYANFRIPGSSESAGGSVDFAQLPNGAWMVRKYLIRMPIIRQQSRFTGGMMVVRPEFYGYREDGGELVEVVDAGGAQLATARRATVAGTVRDLDGTPLAGTRVRLNGTSFVSTTDSLGRFTLRELPDGEYTIAIQHPRHRLLGWISGPDVYLGEGSDMNVTLTVPPFSAIYPLLCGRADTAATGGAAGIARDSAGRPVAHARVRIAWSNWQVSRTSQVSDQWESITTAADSLGYFRACRLPAQKLSQAWIDLPGGGTGATVRFYPVRDSIVELSLTTGRAPPPAAAFNGADITVRGLVLDSVSGAPVADVQVAFAGTPGAGRTDRGGRFRLSAPPAPHSVVEFRRIGYAPHAVTVDASGEPRPEIAMDTVRLVPVSVALDSIAVVAELVQRNPSMSEFFRRRESRPGQFVTQADITRSGPRRTSDVLRQMNGLEIRCEQAGGGKAEQPCRVLSRRSLEPCELDIVLDGHRSSLKIDEIPVAWIAGIEVYTGSTAPAIFTQGACGVVVIWTDRGQG